jgi:alpha-glucosidase (family GH31 glycosyl hydrolase)
MSRPVDVLGDIWFWKYSPKYVMFMGWVGDQGNNVKGFKKAMTNIIHSATAGYLNFGYDIGGYLTKNAPMKWLFLR